jgi:uracil-DNA glycosylase family 4
MNKHPLANCSQCPFEKAPFVPTQNPQPRAKLAVVGEAPGAYEAGRGIPFTGPSGRLLDQVLNHHGYARSEVMVTNICLCLEHNSLVRLANGKNAKISDLVRSKFDGEVLSEENGKLVSKRVIGWYKNPIGNRKLLKITHKAAKRNGQGTVGVTLTNDHEVLTQRGWVRADELIVNQDEICTGLPDFDGNTLQLMLSARLGDGEFYTPTSYQESHCDEQLEYMNLRRDLLVDYNPTPITKYGNRNVYRIKALRALLNITSLSNIEAVEKLDWFGFALWFMDDGYIRPNKWHSEIATTRFSMDEANKIAEILSTKFVDCYVSKTHIGPRIMFGVESTKIISRMIAEYVPDCLKYKLRPEDRETELNIGAWEPEDQSVLYSAINSITEVDSRYSSVYCIDVEDTHRFVTVGGVVHNCRPHNNDDPPKAAIAACKPRLDAELAHSGVEQILAVGGTAASVLIDPKKKISSLRIGPPKPYIENSNIKVVASWHPAYCLRSPDNFPSFVSDAGKLKGKFSSTWTEPDYRVFSSEDSIIEAATRLMNVDGPLVIDIEVGVDKEFSYAHPEHYNLLCIGIAYAKGKAVVFAGAALYVQRVIEVLKKLFRSKKLIGHNGKFDLNGLFPVFGELELYADTMLMSYCLDERPGQHGLKKLAIELLGAPDWESAIKQYIPRGKDYSAIPKTILYKYNAFDVVATWDINELFISMFGDRERIQHDFLIKASNALMYLERAGITFDEEYSMELHEIFEKELYELEVIISNTTGRNLNPRSPMQIIKWFASENFRLETTKAGVLEAVLERQGLPNNIRTFIEQLLLHRRRTKLDGTYVKGFQKRVYGGKVFTTYTLHGTTSGRLASKNPNLQNIVRDKRIKHQFTVTDPDNVLIQVDQKQSEGRVITTLAHDEYLANIFRDPTRDIFNELTEQIYGSVWTKEERVKIKSVFYGLSYGRRAPSIGAALGITIEEARELLANFKALIPATVSWQASVTNRVLAGEDLTTPFGRKRSFWLITEQNREDVINEALSFLPQSISSDITLTALIKLQPRLQNLAIIRLTIHDALIVECKKKNAEQVISIITEEMVAAGRVFTDFVPFVVDVSQGNRWSDL